MHTCPVCGFNKLEFPPDDYNICPSCGTEFDLDDVGVGYDVLREKWKAGGYVWWSRYEAPPFDWDPVKLLNTVEAVTHQTNKIIELKYEELYRVPIHISSLSGLYA
jgi:hypothetical protein